MSPLRRGTRFKKSWQQVLEPNRIHRLVGKEGFRTNPRRLADSHGAFDTISKLADVAWPLLGQQGFLGGGGKAVHLATEGLGELAGKRVSQRQDVVWSVAQRRYGNRDDVDAVVEVAPEAALGDGAL